MAMEVRVDGTCAISHFQTCLLHDDKRTMTCSGTLKKGSNCVNKATGSFNSRMMPTCGIHRGQLKISAWCRALLPCGFECGRLCEWKLHGFQLCLDHLEHPMTCYFLKIPIEMRLRIYQFLLPDKSIPARCGNSSLASDGGGVYTTILRVNHQIHDEAAGLLYSTRAFTIELSRDGLSMCNSKNFAQYRFSCYGNHALQAYPLSFFMAQEQSNIAGASSSTYTPPILGNQPRTKSPIPYTNGPIEPVWDPPLSERYFNMIRSFLIEIVVLPPSGYVLPKSDAETRKALVSRLCDYCDHLHALVGRLGIIQRPIARLEIVIEFGNTYIKRGESIPAQFLLRPFRRLRNVAELKVLSITMQDFRNGAIEYLTPGWDSTPTGKAFAAYLKCLSEDTSSSQPSLELPVFKAYWQLEKLLSRIKEHYHHADPEIGQFADLLHAARTAREADDLARFRVIWERVVNIWFDYLNHQKEFQSNVALSIDTIYGIVKNSS
ncbi:uncharacterized protein PAC_15218 [Phialocephala subalpina]|uniref:Uncharacterized protein n=1 Tax=Phialocephala subalpina TaxID=576137 RepID=A0A1L7XJX5_9HELO|nr:uncharacterized protein PAC_15218 [Phialocephala subalpina]